MSTAENITNYVEVIDPENADYNELLKRLKALSGLSVQDVDASELVDISDVSIKTDLPREERILDFIRQIKNPYCYLDHGTVVKISFAGERTLEQSLIHYIQTMENR